MNEHLETLRKYYGEYDDTRMEFVKQMLEENSDYAGAIVSRVMAVNTYRQGFPDISEFERAKNYVCAA